MSRKTKKVSSTAQLPLLVPDSDWQVPTELPDLAGQSIAMDTETKDIGLLHGVGAGWAHGAGYICGVSAAWDGGGIYAPVRHPDGDCLDVARVKNWTEYTVRNAAEVFFQNAPYDLGWMRQEWGVMPPDVVHDTTAMAVMIDENRLSYKLDSLCRWQGIPGKDETILREAAAAYGFPPSEIKENLWQLPSRYVGPYAEADAVSTLALAKKLRPQLLQDQVWEAYRLECDLIPLCLEMRRRGIRIDEDAAQRAYDNLIARRDEVLAFLSRQIGEKVDVFCYKQTDWLERQHDAVGISYPRTPKTNRGSFKAGSRDGWMQKHNHWLPANLAMAWKFSDGAEKFIRGYIMDFTHRGRLHANLNQFRSEDGGTRSHRFSISDPPLQQMPERDDILGPLIRSLFLPEPGEIWGTHDYSQQEYRMIVHCAALLNCRRAEEAVDLYIADPKTDFHNLVVQWTGLDRKRAKDCNFGKAFGAGVPKFAEMIGKTEEEAAEIYKQYDEKLPFVADAAQKCSRLAERRGYIRLIDKARCHFDHWTPAQRGRWVPARKTDARYQEWVNDGITRFRRAFTHKAFNRFVQGSSARQMKMGMRDCWREGIVPMLQMHDELDVSHSSEKQGKRVNEIMRNAYTLAVPSVVDSEYGISWGDARKSDDHDVTWRAARARLKAR